jgi:hypothetical protein
MKLKFVGVVILMIILCTSYGSFLPGSSRLALNTMFLRGGKKSGKRKGCRQDVFFFMFIPLVYLKNTATPHSQNTPEYHS